MRLKRQILSALLALSMLLTLMPATGFAQEGDGSPASPFQITSQEELAAVTGSNSYLLMNDITLAGTWTPLSGFRGTLDGNGKAIRGLKVETSGDAGLFSSIGSGATIKNLTLYGTVVSTGTYYTQSGGFVGENDGTITDCTFYGSVSNTAGGNICVGGIVGLNEDYGSVSGCTNYGDVTGHSTGGGAYVGGMIGSNHGAIENCSNYGIITGSDGSSYTYVGELWGSTSWANSGAYVGGIAGDASIADGGDHGCQNFGEVIGYNNNNSADLTGITAPAKVTLATPASSEEELKVQLPSSIILNTNGGDRAGTVVWDTTGYDPGVPDATYTFTGAISLPANVTNNSGVPLNTAITVIVGNGAPVVSYGVWVGGVQVTSDNASNVLGDGTVSYTPAANGQPQALILNHANITQVAQANGCGIYAEEALHIVLVEGSANTVDVSALTTGDRMAAVGCGGNLSVSGAGSLTATGPSGTSMSCGINTAGSLDISGSTVSASGKDATDASLGAMAAGGLTLSGDAALDLTCGAAAEPVGGIAAAAYVSSVTAGGFDIAGSVESGAQPASLAAAKTGTVNQLPTIVMDGGDNDGAVAKTVRIAKPAPAPKHSHDMSVACGSEAPVEYTALPSGFIGGTLAAGNYYLTNSVTLASTIQITGAVNLCLNGNSISLPGGAVFDLPANGVLSLCDCVGTGSVTANAADSTVNVQSGGTYSLYGGTVENTNSSGSALSIMGNANLSGGTVNSAGNAVYVGAGGGVTLSGTPAIAGGDAKADICLRQGGADADSAPITAQLAGGNYAGGALEIEVENPAAGQYVANGVAGSNKDTFSLVSDTLKLSYHEAAEALVIEKKVPAGWYANWFEAGEAAVQGTDYAIDQAGNYTVYTAKGLAKIANQVVADNTVFFNKTVTLAKDIDLMDGKVYQYAKGTVTAENSWNPIGTFEYDSLTGDASVYPFLGVFDGSGFAVKNLYMNVSESVTGLFGSVLSDYEFGGQAEVKNVKLIGADITGGFMANGGIAGFPTDAVISGCHVDETSVITILNNAQMNGGIAGGMQGRVAEGTCLIENCTFNGTITGGMLTGGIAGATGGKIVNCANNGAVSGSESIGGIVGYFSEEPTLVQNPMFEISNCQNTGAVSATSSAVGGIAGEVYIQSSQRTGLIANCFNTGAITGASSVGGVTGSLRNCALQSSYNAGTVRSTNTPSTNIGSVAGGVFTGGSIENCYYDTDIYTETDATQGVTGKTTAQFASGEVAHLLQGSQAAQVWAQDITATKDARPILSGDAAKKVCKVVFATGSNANYSTAYTNTNKTVTLPAAPAMEHYQFAKWSKTNATAGEEFTASTAVTGDLTVYAVMEREFEGTDKDGTIPLTYRTAMQALDLKDYVQFADTGLTDKTDFIFSLAQGQSLPAGLTLANGIVSGTPTADVDTYTVVFDVTDSNPFVLFSLAPTPATQTAKLTLQFHIEKAKPQAVTFPTAGAIVYGEALSQSSLTGGAGGGTFAWQDGSVVAPVTNNGYTVVFTPDDADNYDYSAVAGYDAASKTVQQTVQVSVSQRPVSITWSGTEGLVYNHTLKSVTAEVANRVGSDTVHLTLENNSATNHGEYTAAVTAVDNENYTLDGGQNLTKQWSIAKANPSYEVPAGVEATYGDTLADVMLPAGFRWEDSAGTAVGNAGEQTFTATFTPADTANYNTVAGIPVTITVNPADPVYTVPSGLTAVYGQTLANVTLPAGFTWQEAGTTPVGNAGNNGFDVTFTPADTANYNTIRDIEVTVAVQAFTPALTFNTGNPQGVGENRSVDLIAVVSGTTGGETPSGTVRFLSGETEIGTGTLENGSVTFPWTHVPVGTHTLRAVYGGNANYTTAQADTTYSLDRDSQAALAVVEIPAKTYGDAPFVLAVTGGSGTGALSYAVASGDSVSVDENGRITILKAGESVITVTKAADANYNEASATAAVAVAQRAPEIAELPEASRVWYGKALSTSNLSGGKVTGLSGTELEGTWTWKTGEKEMTETGTFEEVAIFTPVDTNYAAVEAENVPVAVYRTASGSSTTRYTVAFNTQGASKIGSVRVAKNSTVTKPDEPEREGYVFDGWFTDRECTEAFDFDTKVTKSMTLYAKWTEESAEPTPSPTPEPTPQPTPAPEPTEWENPFTDVSAGDWFYDAVRYAQENGLFGGTTATAFAPDEAITRGMLVTVLYRAEGEPPATGSSGFDDISADAYYSKAVLWAENNGIVKGYSDAEFAPDKLISREEMATVMQRYADYKGIDTSAKGDLSQFGDQSMVADWARGNVEWAVGYGLIAGGDDGRIAPQGNTTRAQAAVMLQRFLEK